MLVFRQKTCSWRPLRGIEPFCLEDKRLVPTIHGIIRLRIIFMNILYDARRRDIGLQLSRDEGSPDFGIKVIIACFQSGGTHPRDKHTLNIAVNTGARMFTFLAMTS